MFSFKFNHSRLFEMKFYINIPTDKEVKVFIQEDRCEYCSYFKTIRSMEDIQFNPYDYMPLLTEDVNVYIYTTDRRDEASYCWFFIFLLDNFFYPGDERKIN